MDIFGGHFWTVQMIHGGSGISGPLVLGLRWVFGKLLQIIVESGDHVVSLCQLTVRTSKIDDEMNRVMAVMKGFRSFFGTRQEPILDLTNATSAVATRVEMFNYSGDSFLQRFGVIKRHATPHYVKV